MHSNTLKKPFYQNPELSLEERIIDLLGRMTIEEKVRQVNMYPWIKEDWLKSAEPSLSVDGEYSPEYMDSLLGDNMPGMIRGIDRYRPGVSAKLANRLQKHSLERSRLGIPFMFIAEGLHGYHAPGSTTFAQNIGLASSWDSKLLFEVGKTVAAQARAAGITVLKAPVLDLALDARFGRIEESFGEDPFLVSVMGVEMVKGLQGKTLSDSNTVIAEVKHFAAYGSCEGGKNAAPANIGERRMREMDLVPFEAVFKKAGAKAVMSSYNEIDGVPCTSNPYLLKKILREEWSFDGFVQSDTTAIGKLCSDRVAVSDEDAIRQAVESGVDIQNYDYECKYYEAVLIQLIHEGKLCMEHLDRAVKSILRVKFMLGLFENPYVDEKLYKKMFYQPEQRNLALKTARESICLLKNEGNILPLKKDVESISVIGPNAFEARLGSYINATEEHLSMIKPISVLEGIKNIVSPKTKVFYAKGAELKDNDKTEDINVNTAYKNRFGEYEKSIGKLTVDNIIRQAVKIAEKSEVSVLVLGEASWVTSGEGFDKTNLELPECQKKLIREICKTGTKVIVILINGRPLAINWSKENVCAILEAWYPGQEGGRALAEVLFGEYNPAGRLPVSFPKSVGQIPIYYYKKPGSINRRYIDDDGKPLFSFGYGLSYTEFSYSNLNVIPNKTRAGESVKVSVNVENTGNYDGDEVVQLYLSDLAASVTPMELMLKGFTRVNIKKGSKRTVEFTISPEQMGVVGKDYKRAVEPGEFEVRVGGSLSDGLRTRFKII